MTGTMMVGAQEGGNLGIHWSNESAENSYKWQKIANSEQIARSAVQNKI